MLGDMSAQVEQARQCARCGQWMQLRSTQAGNEWLHVKVDGRSEQVQAECFPEDRPRPPKLGETVVVTSADKDGHRHERAAIVGWTSRERFTAWCFPESGYGQLTSVEIEVDQFGKVPACDTEPFCGWRWI